MKICSKCNIKKPLSMFDKNKRNKDGYYGMCKECRKHWVNNNRDKVNATQRRYNINHPERTWCRSSITNHLRCGYEVNITIEQLIDLAQKTNICKYCGVKLDYTTGNKGGRMQIESPSLDRKNNDSEMNVDNVQIICHECNRTKGKRTDEEFINYCKKVGEIKVIKHSPRMDDWSDGDS